MVLRLLAEEGGQMQSQERRRPLSVHGGVGGGVAPHRLRPYFRLSAKDRRCERHDGIRVGEATVTTWFCWGWRLTDYHVKEEQGGNDDKDKMETFYCLCAGI